MFRLTKTIRRSTIVYRNRYVRKYYRRVNERLRARGTSPAIFQFILIGIIYQRLTPMLLLNARAFFSCRNGGVNENPRRPLNDFHTKIPIPKEKEHVTPFSHFHRTPHSRVISLIKITDTKHVLEFVVLERQEKAKSPTRKGFAKKSCL